MGSKNPEVIESSIALSVITPVQATATSVSKPNIVFTTGAATTTVDVYATAPANIWARSDIIELFIYPVGSTTVLNQF